MNMERELCFDLYRTCIEVYSVAEVITTFTPHDHLVVSVMMRTQVEYSELMRQVIPNRAHQICV